MLRLNRTTRVALAVITVIALGFMYIPLFVIVMNSFNSSRVSGWPIPGFSLEWWGKALTNPAVHAALLNSVIVASVATAFALLLGTLAAFALQRFRFFGKQTVNLLIVLPITLPGIVTGVALSNTYFQVLKPMGINVGYWGMIIAHATFCVVMVFNNVIARLRRMHPNLDEASMDLGAGIGQTFRLVTFPQFRSAFIAGGLLAFALSFDEIVVTIFTAPPGVETLPLWIMNQMARPNEVNQVNVVATVMILLSLIPVYISQRVSAVTDAK
ncbi:ABC transporter permease [Leucobacter chromiiresistens]|uniref:Putative spermidine/putrescine transport system permease protein n=1 Tax=Leucobacter chromiiresistens TaxID=1079994 RepID=A0A1H0XVY6_9MICO|nr:ABC transporter permease [Leucobacter chromiiresistens]SDQ07087.1 putative spermidine/putrescine transport system permease protein [Leucobacter chromiiresistens]